MSEQDKPARPAPEELRRMGGGATHEEILEEIHRMREERTQHHLSLFQKSNN